MWAVPKSLSIKDGAIQNMPFRYPALGTVHGPAPESPSIWEGIIETCHLGTMIERHKPKSIPNKDRALGNYDLGTQMRGHGPST